MANPYHDEAGRFCSGDEMRSAVARLRDAGKIGEALDLSIELADIERDRRREQQAEDPKLQTLYEEFATAEKGLSYSELTGTQLASKWALRREEDVDLWEKGDFLAARGVTPELRDQIISTLNFGDRYELLSETDNQYAKETVLALLAGQENESENHLDADSLYWSAMHQLPAAESAAYATRSPSLANNYYNIHGWLQGNPEFDRLLLESASEINNQLLYERVATHTRSPEVLTRLLGVSGINSGALVNVAKNPALKDEQVLLLVDRAGNRLDDYPKLRRNLLENEHLSWEMRQTLSSAPISLPAAQRDVNLPLVDAALAHAGGNLHSTNAQLRSAQSGSEPVSTYEYYRRVRAAHEAKFNFERAVIAREALPKQHTALLRKKSSQLRDAQIARVQAYLQHQSDVQALLEPSLS